MRNVAASRFDRQFALLGAMVKRALYLMAYDITCPRRRARTLKAIKAHGIGGQKSAHECTLSRRERRDLETALRGILDDTQDRLLVLRLDPRTRVQGLGTAKKPDASWFFVG